jgi:hypothetical protein
MDTTNFGQGNDPPGRQSPSAADLPRVPSDFARATRSSLARPGTRRSPGLIAAEYVAYKPNSYVTYRPLSAAEVESCATSSGRADRAGGNDLLVECRSGR